MYELINFENRGNIEVLEYGNKFLFNPYNIGDCLELSHSAVRMAIKSMTPSQVILLTNSDVQNMNFRKLNNRGENFLTQSGVYKLIFKSNKPEADKMCNWLADEVLPILAKYGTYTIKQKEVETPFCKTISNLSQATEQQISRILNNQQTEIQTLKDDYTDMRNQLQDMSKTIFKLSTNQITQEPTIKEEYDIFYKINEARYWTNKQFINITKFIKDNPNFIYTHVPSIMKQVYIKIKSVDNINLDNLKTKYEDKLNRNIGVITAISFEPQIRELFEKHLTDVLQDKKYYTNICQDKSSPFYKIDELDKWIDIADNLLCKDLREKNIVRDCNILSKLYSILEIIEAEQGIELVKGIDSKQKFNLDYLYTMIFNSIYRNSFENILVEQSK